MAAGQSLSYQALPGTRQRCWPILIVLSALTRQVEYQNLGIPAILDVKLGSAADAKRIAGIERNSIRQQRAARNVHVDAPAAPHLKIRRFSAVEQSRIDARVLVDQQ